MENKIRKYIDELFEGIVVTRSLQDMKEEIQVNLLEKINDYITAGEAETDAFEHAIADLGNMDELIEGLKKASQRKQEENLSEAMPLQKNHIAGYVIASAIFLLGLVAAGFMALQSYDYLVVGKVFSPFLILSIAVFTYFGLTQETRETYAMDMKRALSYSAATALLLIGAMVSLFAYLKNMEFAPALIYLTVFSLPAIILFIYLGLSEKSRSKFNVMDTAWQRNWIDKYANTRNKKVKDLLSGAIWVFAAAFFMLGLLLGFWFAWLIFLFAVGFQILLEATFAAKM